MTHRHPANIVRHDKRGFGQRMADAAANGMGSWPFILTQTAVITGWVALNVTAYVHHWDAYPFILLNLAFSTQAAYAAPLILLSQKRQSEHDRLKAEHDYGVNEASFAEIKANTELTRTVHELVAEVREHMRGKEAARD